MYSPCWAGALAGSVGHAGQEKSLARGAAHVVGRSPGGVGMGGGSPESGSRVGLGEAR